MIRGKFRNSEAASSGDIDEKPRGREVTRLLWVRLVECRVQRKTRKAVEDDKSSASIA